MSTNTTDASHGIVLSQRQYDILKDVDLIALPALGTAYGTLATLYGWGYVAQVVGTIGVVIFLIGVLLKISSVQYKAKAAVAAVLAASIVNPEILVSPANPSQVIVAPSIPEALDSPPTP